jgi:hypothetical protein
MVMVRSRLSGFHQRLAAMVGATALLAAAAAADAQVRTGQVRQGEGGNRCCVNNFRFAGTCEVTVGSGESCRDVVSYLNNLQSTGKAYCGGTLIRGGWTLVQCQESTGSGGAVTPGTAVTAPPARSPETVRPSATGSVGTTNQTFVTPVDGSNVSVQSAGIINL